MAATFMDLGMRCQPTSLFFTSLCNCAANCGTIGRRLSEVAMRIFKAVGRLLHDVSRTYAEQYR